VTGVVNGATRVVVCVCVCVWERESESEGGEREEQDCDRKHIFSHIFGTYIWSVLHVIRTIVVPPKNA